MPGVALQRRRDHCPTLASDIGLLHPLTSESNGKTEFVQAQGHRTGMGSTNSCIRHFKNILSSVVGGWSNSTGLCARGKSKRASGERTSVEQQIEYSQLHWSQLSEFDSSSNDEEAADNRKVFQALQLHPTWGAFFKTFGYDLGIGYASAGSLEVGAKFAEGAQAELFHAHVTWRLPEDNEEDRKRGIEWAVKVFKKGTLLRHLQSQWPHGYLQWWAELLKQTQLGKFAFKKYQSDVMYGTLLKDGRFAFLMVKEQEDLRSVIHKYWQNPWTISKRQ